jgi:SAM-dependent methyltransferase
MPISQNSYIGRHAELYDLFYAEKPYTEEAAFIHRCIQAHKPNARTLLELACGTGTHSLLLEKYGYKIIATDYSPEMLRRAKQKAQKEGSRVSFRQQDMRALDVPERPFDAIICLFDSIGYVATNKDILQVLKGIQHHLSPDGIFLFEFWHAGAMLRHYEPLRVRRFQTPRGGIERISETRISYPEQVCYVSYTINEMNNDGTYQTTLETQQNRFFLVQEMKFFLEQADLAPIKWYAGFQDEEEIDDATWHIVCLARSA